MNALLNQYPPWYFYTISDPGRLRGIHSESMVKLTKIYTRSGDSGQTGLGNGQRVSKHDPRVEAYGTVDEANAVLGIAVHTARETQASFAQLLESIQHDLFDVGADLCTPIKPDETPESALRILPERVEMLEREIDKHNEPLSPLNSFVLPGGSRLSAELHVARTVSRRAERAVTRLLDAEPDTTSVVTMTYLNRLSDLLFVLARAANNDGRDDVLWVPGKNRSH